MSDDKNHSVSKNLFWVVSELALYSKTYLFLIAIDAVMKAILPVAALILTQNVINVVQEQNASMQTLLLQLLLLIAIEAFNEISGNYVYLWLNNYELKFENHTQKKLLEKISRIESKNFEDSSIYDLISRTQYDSNAGILGNVKVIFSILSIVISLVSYTLIIIQLSFGVFIFVGGIALLRYYFEKKYNLKEYDTILKNTEINRKSAYVFHLLTNAEQFKEIKIYKLFSHFIFKYTAYRNQHVNDLIGLHRERTKIYSMISILDVLIDAFITLRIVLEVFAGRLLIGKFILYNQAINAFKQNLVALFSYISHVYKNNAMIEQLRRFYAIKEEVLNENGIKIHRVEVIELVDVSYKYQKDKYVLKNINLTIKASEMVVLMGHNGAGKSSIIKIIMGIYHDYEGQIFVNGINLKDLDLDHYRRKIGVLFQDYIKYETSIEDNVFLGNLAHYHNKDKLNGVLRNVKLDEFIENPQQQLGYQFATGRQISIGQWQKLALARCLLCEADVYIFDEPNAALDLASEKNVIDTLVREVDQKIGIFIVHRFNKVVRKADKIVVLNEGQIVEVGDHDTLIAKGQRYYELYSIYEKV